MYSSECGGSFIPSWKYYADMLARRFKIETGWVFPYQQEKDWIRQLKNDYPVYFIPLPNGKKVVMELGKIISQFQPDIIHTHFEQYDISVAKAVKRFGSNIKMVWHIHDYMDFSVKGQTYPLLRYVRRRVLYALRYHIYGKNAWFVPVSLEMAHFVNHFRHHFFTVPKEYIPEKTNVLSERITPLLNGLFLPRLGDLPQRKAKQRSIAFRFLSFGTNFHRKGIATLLAAGKLLSNKKYEFQIIITRGNNLEKSVRSYFAGNLPPWVKIVPQTDQVRDLFLNADCYISPSRRETMCYAIAEAEMFLLPVIQNDSYGTLWNADMPSVFLFPSDNDIRLAEQMKQVMTADEEELSEKTLQTRERLQKLLDLDCWCERLVEIYKSL